MHVVALVVPITSEAGTVDVVVTRQTRIETLSRHRKACTKKMCRQVVKTPTRRSRKNDELGCDTYRKYHAQAQYSPNVVG